MQVVHSVKCIEELQHLLKLQYMKYNKKKFVSIIYINIKWEKTQQKKNVKIII